MHSAVNDLGGGVPVDHVPSQEDRSLSMEGGDGDGDEGQDRDSQGQYSFVLDLLERSLERVESGRPRLIHARILQQQIVILESIRSGEFVTLPDSEYRIDDYVEATTAPVFTASGGGAIRAFVVDVEKHPYYLDLFAAPSAAGYGPQGRGRLPGESVDLDFEEAKGFLVARASELLKLEGLR